MSTLSCIDTLTSAPEDGADGATGASIVYAGEWNSTTNYAYTAVLRPYVKYRVSSDADYIYYLRKGDVEDCVNINPWDDVTGANSYWSYTASQDLILAIKIDAEQIDVDNLTVKQLETDNGKVKISNDGSIEAEDVNLTGEINATSGKVGNFNLTEQNLTSTKANTSVELYNSSDGSVAKFSNGTMSDISSAGSTTSNYYNISAATTTTSVSATTTISGYTTVPSDGLYVDILTSLTIYGSTANANYRGGNLNVKLQCIVEYEDPFGDEGDTASTAYTLYEENFNVSYASSSNVNLIGGGAKVSYPFGVNTSSFTPRLYFRLYIYLTPTEYISGYLLPCTVSAASVATTISEPSKVTEFCSDGVQVSASATSRFIAKVGASGVVLIADLPIIYDDTSSLESGQMYRDASGNVKIY